MNFHDARKVFQKAIFCLLSVICAIARGDVLILSPDTPAAQAIASKIAGKLEAPTIVSDTISFNPELIIAVGDSSFIDATTKVDIPVIGTFLTASETTLPDRQSTYAIYSDPTAVDVATQLVSLFPNSKIGYVYTDSDEQFVSDIIAQLDGSGTSLVAIQHTGNTFDGIRTVISSGIDAMLITRNRTIYRPENIRFVLESLFRKGVPVVSTIETLLPAGAVVAITTDEASVINRTTEKAQAVLKGNQPGPTQVIRVTHITLKINKSMSNYFGIKTPGSPQ